jgi:hypothetical protein
LAAEPGPAAESASAAVGRVLAARRGLAELELLAAVETQHLESG